MEKTTTYLGDAGSERRNRFVGRLRAVRVCARAHVHQRPRDVEPPVLFRHSVQALVVVVVVDQVAKRNVFERGDSAGVEPSVAPFDNDSATKQRLGLIWVPVVIVVDRRGLPFGRGKGRVQRPNCDRASCGRSRGGRRQTCHLEKSATARDAAVKPIFENCIRAYISVNGYTFAMCGDVR